jgi:DNA-binding transcriptional MerR regulator
MTRINRIAWLAGSTLMALLLTAASPFLGPRGGKAAAQYAQDASPPAAPAKPQKLLGKIQGPYDVEELKRLIQIARESGFSDEQIREITVEDEAGNTINAYEFLQAYEKAQKAEAARIAAEQSKVYLAPQDITRELDKKQPKDLEQLRDKMLFVD